MVQSHFSGPAKIHRNLCKNSKEGGSNSKLYIFSRSGFAVVRILVRLNLIKMTDTRRRVKLYALNAERQWDDKGTGHVTSTYVERLKGMSLLVRAESDGESFREKLFLQESNPQIAQVDNQNNNKLCQVSTRLATDLTKTSLRHFQS